MIKRLEPLIGEWSIQAKLPGAPEGDIGARMVFEWMPGETFLVQRWQIPVPEAPDGLAVIGFHEDRFLQHYFDSRGVARVYEMSFEDGTWRLWRDKPDFSPLDFSQRYTGTVSEDGNTIGGAWEICHDGKTWEHDFELIYARID
jgi:hypothetical protein